MTADPRELLSGPPRYLPPELADLLRDALARVDDAETRRAVRKLAEAAFDAGFALGFDDPTPDVDRRQNSTGYSYSAAAVHTAAEPMYDTLQSRTERVQLP